MFAGNEINSCTFNTFLRQFLIGHKHLAILKYGLVLNFKSLGNEMSLGMERVWACTYKKEKTSPVFDLFSFIFNEMQYKYVEAIAGPFYNIMKVMMKGPNKQSNTKLNTQK